MNLNLPDSEATEALGRALARSLPGEDAAQGGEATQCGEATQGGAAPQGARPARAGDLPSGAVVFFHGELGAGKTTCVRSLLRALGVVGLVRSPTYTLVETYPVGALTCVHIDLYRLQTLNEVDELGLRDLLGPGCLLLVEWPDKGGQALPAADLEVSLRYAGDQRSVCLRGVSPVGAEWMENLGRDSSLSSYVSNLT